MFEPTIKDIAKICGVGVSTVSRAINNHPDINLETKEKIMNTIKEYGYVPNNSARNLKRVDAKAIAVLVKGISNPFFANMIKIIEEECKKKHYSMELSHIESDEDEVDVALKVVKEKRLRGIIFLGGLFSHSDEKLQKLNVPFVFSTAGSIPENISRSQFSNIGVDDRKESAKLIDYLVQQGHEQIAIVVAEAEEESIGKLRLEGYQDALRVNHIEIKEELICHANKDISHFSLENGYLTTKKLLESKVPFTALYAVSDTLAIGAMRALFDEGLKVPDDVSVVGYDGIEMAGYVNPRLTTIKQPVEEIAKATIKLLFDIIAGKKDHQHMTFDASLVEGETIRTLKRDY